MKKFLLLVICLIATMILFSACEKTGEAAKMGKKFVSDEESTAEEPSDEMLPKKEFTKEQGKEMLRELEKIQKKHSSDVSIDELSDAAGGLQ